MPKPTIKGTMRAIRNLGLQCSYDSQAREFRVSRKGGAPDEAYYTNDAEDALCTARVIVTDAVRADALVEEEIAVVRLVEPAGEPRTHYGRILRHMADQLNTWSILKDAGVQELHDQLYHLLREAERVGCLMDSAVAALNRELEGVNRG
jgi:hypothetical protein